MAYVKIGFHGGLGGNHTGIGDYMRQLDQAKIPFCIKSVNNVGLAVEAARYGVVSGVQHNVILRFTNPNGANDDLPDFNLPPYESAGEHWARVKISLDNAPEHLPYKDIIWIEPTNEIDTHTQAEFLGWFSYHIAKIANQDGYRVCLSGHNAGQPEPEHWHLEGFQKFLQYCANNPEMSAVSLHEGKLGDMNASPEVYYPHLIGRFEWLYKACDEMGIDRPTTFISEWAWAYNNMPSVEHAMNDVKWLAELVTKYSTLRGVFLWNLGGGSQWGNLPDKLQQLIEPVTRYAVDTTFPDIDPIIPPNETIPPTEMKHTIHLLPQDTTHSELTAITNYLHPSRSAFTYSADVAHAVVYAGNDESKVIVWDGWRWQDDIFAWLSARNIQFQAREFSSIINNIPDPNPPPPILGDGNAKLGLHASADPHMPNDDFQEFANLQPEIIKVLSFHEPTHIEKLVNEHPNASWIVRAFLSMFENGNPRDISPTQFFNDTISDVKRTLHILQGKNVMIELHNEPNLNTEGLDGSWFDGASFSSWYKAVLMQYRQALPDVGFLYPGLSPGHSFDDGYLRRIAHTQFINDSQDAVILSDGLAIHAYWANENDIANAIAVVDDYIAQFPDMQIWITESSNNQSGNADEMANQYVAFWQEMRNRPNIQGVTYFVASASNQDFAKETWTDRNIGAKIQQLIQG